MIGSIRMLTGRRLGRPRPWFPDSRDHAPTQVIRSSRLAAVATPTVASSSAEPAPSHSAGSAGGTTTGYATYIGRIGALAVALGVGGAIATGQGLGAGVAWRPTTRGRRPIRLPLIHHPLIRRPLIRRPPIRRPPIRRRPRRRRRALPTRPACPRSWAHCARSPPAQTARRCRGHPCRRQTRRRAASRHRVPQPRIPPRILHPSTPQQQVTTRRRHPTSGMLSQAFQPANRTPPELRTHPTTHPPRSR